MAIDRPAFQKVSKETINDTRAGIDDITGLIHRVCIVSRSLDGIYILGVE